MDASQQINPDSPYNPLDKKNLGVSVVDALLAKPVCSLPPEETFVGAGIYAIYYVGNFIHYRSIAIRNSNSKYLQPIYVGKAIPKGGRKGGVVDEAGPVLYKRLCEHASSIDAAKNLEIDDFRCRYLTVDDIWIPLAESLMIQIFKPIWNGVIDGFGNHDPGSGRHQGQIPPWDVLHPGRPWALRLQQNKRSETEIILALKRFDEKWTGNSPLQGES